MFRTSVNVMTGEGTVVYLTPEEIAAIPAPEPPLVPPLSARQLRLALLGLGLTGTQVEAQIAAMPGTPAQREAALIEWEYATTYQRDHPLVALLGAALGLTEAQIDEAWRSAAVL
jgi:hypothetical protein